MARRRQGSGGPDTRADREAGTKPPKQRRPKKLVPKADGSYPLTSAQEEVLAHLLDEAATTSSEVATRMMSFGRLVLLVVFDGNANAARNPRRVANPLWLELRRRAGGPTLRLSEYFISVAVRLAAWDKTITDESWRLLDPRRKELLLPLRDADRLREAAQHVMSFKLDDDATRDYVEALRQAAGRPPKSRLTPARARVQARELVARFRKGRAVQRLAEAAAEMPPRERAKLVKELEELGALADELQRAVKTR